MEKIGFIGLGIMGKPMAQNLIKAGYSLLLLKKNRGAEEMVEVGAETFPSSRDIAQHSDILITMLPYSPQVEEVISGPEGVLQGIRQGSLFIDMSTIDPSTAKKIYLLMQQKGVEALDAPVSGGEAGAISGSLSIMVGGSLEAFQRALQLFQVMGKNIVRIGEAGAGQMAKTCNQIIVGMTIRQSQKHSHWQKKQG